MSPLQATLETLEVEPFILVSNRKEILNMSPLQATLETLEIEPLEVVIELPEMESEEVVLGENDALPIESRFTCCLCCPCCNS